jgi:hypothetical protein
MPREPPQSTPDLFWRASLPNPYYTLAAIGLKLLVLALVALLAAPAAELREVGVVSF